MSQPIHLPVHLIDTHCHLDFDYPGKTHQDLVREARLAGVDYLITIGTTLEFLQKIVAISEQYSEVFHTVGVHPHDSIEMTDMGLDLLEKAAQHSKCKAIGEIGLDYHYDHSPREVQRKCFDDQLTLALQLQKPVVIHSREADGDILLALKQYVCKLKSGFLPGVLHCFSGSTYLLDACLEMGFYFSFSGILTFKNAETLRECARKIPINRILVETDSPFLAPVPFRGKTCEPSMVRLVAEKLAEVRGISLEEVARLTTENARKLFDF